MGVGKARGDEAVRRIGNTYVLQPCKENKLIDRGIDFHFWKYSPGYLDELSASDFYRRKELGGLIMDEGLTIDCPHSPRHRPVSVP